jgi:hypothetical protein
VPGKPTKSRLECADIDPELERVRRADAEQLAGEEPLLDLTPLGRACSRRGTGRGCDASPSRWAANLWISSGGAAALREDEVRRPLSTRSAISFDASRARSPLAELLVDERRVPERDGPLGFGARPSPIT